MIKFILVSVVVILIILGIYTYSNQTTEKSSPTPSVSKKKKEAEKTEKVSIVAQEVKEIEEKKSSEKSIMVDSPKVVLEEPTQEMENEEEIGEDIRKKDLSANSDMYAKEGIKEDMLKKYLPEVPFERDDSYRVPTSIIEDPSNLLTKEELRDMKP